MTYYLEWYLSKGEIYFRPGDFHTSNEGMLGYEILRLQHLTSRQLHENAIKISV